MFCTDKEVNKEMTFNVNEHAAGARTYIDK